MSNWRAILKMCFQKGLRIEREKKSARKWRALRLCLMGQNG